MEEGKKVTIVCAFKTKVPTSLKYTFYKDSQIIQHAGAKTYYVINKAGEDHTGTYQCSVQSQNGKVRKNSTSIHILVQSECKL